MAWSRFVDGLGWVKDKAKKVHRALPAADKVTAMMGTAVFNADKFAAWVLRVPSGLSTPLGISLAIVLTVGVGVDNLIGRYFIMYRREKPKTPQITPVPSLNNLDENPTLELTPQEIAKNASLLYPGIDTSYLRDFGYKLFQLQCVLYLGNSAMGGFLSKFSLAQLISKTPGLEFDSTCEDTHSNYIAISLVHLAALYSSYSSILSFLKYNLIRSREYYAYYIIQKHWRDIGFLSYAETLTGVSINTIGIIFNNKHTWELLEKNSFCHINAVPIPSQLIQAQSWEACVANFVVTTASTLPAVHKRHSNQMKKELTALLEEVPSFKPWHNFIKGCIGLASLNAGLGIVVATAKLPETVNHELSGLSYEWWMITIATLCGIVAVKNQLALSSEAYVQELEARAKEAAEERSIANASLSQQLLNDNTSIATTENSPTSEKIDEEDHVIDIADGQNQHEPAFLAKTLVAQSEKVSVAPSATLFGASNPANPNAAKKIRKHTASNDTTIDATPLLDETNTPAKHSICILM
jgi:hypothetical protein